MLARRFTPELHIAAGMWRLRNRSSTALETRTSTAPTAPAENSEPQEQVLPQPNFSAIQWPDSLPSGLRGLNNMGHTCFMNSILQCMLHLPLLREYHLGLGHTRQHCSVATSGGHCIACELYSVFSSALCGERTPYSPSAFLHAWWELAGGALGGGCKQQDAHEFFLFILEMLAAGAGKDCLAMQLFRGVVRSEVVCSNCGGSSAVQDDFTHLSLDIPPHTTIIPRPIISRPNFHAAHGKAGVAVAKANKQLVGAAKAAHLAKLRRQSVCQNHLDMKIETTPEPSSLLGTDVPMDDTVSELTSVDLVVGRVGDGASSHGPIGAAENNPGTSTDAGMDTLSSPRGGINAKKLLKIASSDPGSNSGGRTSDGASTVQGSQNKSQSASIHPALAGYSRWPGTSLVGCLRRFIWPERLGPSEQWICPRCSADCGAIKQLSLERLPPVLVLHAKRFEHDGNRKSAAKKLDTFLSFPLENLNMVPYLTAAIIRERYVARAAPPQGTSFLGTGDVSECMATGSARPHSAGPMSTLRTRSSGAGTSAGKPGATTLQTPISRSVSASTFLGSDAPAIKTSGDSNGAVENTAITPSRCQYDLLGIVCHRGTFQGGHYVAYVRAQDGRWYLCDDACVSLVNEDIVRNSQAYMLFYTQKNLVPWRRKHKQ